jgi:hypothetical protein
MRQSMQFYCLNMFRAPICTASGVKGKGHPLTGHEGRRGSRGIAVLILDLGDRRGVWSAPRPGRFTPGKDPVPTVQEAGWALVLWCSVLQCSGLASRECVSDVKACSHGTPTHTHTHTHTHTQPMFHSCMPSHHWQTHYSLNHYTATHCTITLGLTILLIFSRYGHLKVEVIY